jgi:hypothetical protein
MCLSNGWKEREGLPGDLKEFKALSGLYPHNWGVKGITLLKIPTEQDKRPIMMLKHHNMCPSLNPPRKLQNENFWHWRQIWHDCEQQLENSILTLTCLESYQETNTIVIEYSFIFSTVIYTPWYDKRFRSYAILKSVGRLEFLCWSDLSNLRILPFWVQSKHNLRKFPIPNS